MNTFTVAFLCIQACLVQNVFGVCLPAPLAAIAPCGALSPAAALSPFGAGALANASPFGYPAAAPYAGYAAPYGNAAAPYGGSGEGNVAVAGELPVSGTTAVTGQVPIMGAVQFSGPVSAAGSVSIVGQCACGCNSPYLI